MRNLENVGADGFAQLAASNQLPFPIGLKVPRKQQAPPAERDAEDQRGVVHAQTFWGSDALAGSGLNEGPERTQLCRPQRPRLDDRKGDAAPSRHREQPSVLGIAAVVAARPEATDVEPFEDSEQATQVIRMRMRERHQVYMPDAANAQEWLDDARAGVESTVARPSSIQHHD